MKLWKESLFRNIEIFKKIGLFTDFQKRKRLEKALAQGGEIPVR